MSTNENAIRKAKLRYYFDIYGMTLRDVAKAAGVSYPPIQRKVNDIDSFTVGEMKWLIETFKIADEDVKVIFHT